ncbi:MAG TPA: hypothetical protein VNN10_01020 [Dehalococcoidia bacterium]|nr:hypothetical protein [Dehalococcoidia bacterium]
MSRGLVAWIAMAALVAALGVLAGRALRGSGGGTFDFDATAPAYSAADLPMARSRGGFTGFGETGGLDGSVLVSGRVSAAGPDSITLETSTGRNVIRLSGEQKLRILRPHQGSIAPGTTVAVLKKPGTDEAQAVLLLLNP